MLCAREYSVLADANSLSATLYESDADVDCDLLCEFAAE
jgi:hypothetical protein